MTARLDRLRGALGAAGFTGAVVSRPTHVHYLSGYNAPASGYTFLVAGPHGTALVVAGREPAAGSLPSEIQAFPYQFYRPTVLREAEDAAEEALLAAIDTVGLRGGAIGIESDHLPFGLAQALAGVGDVTSLDGEIERMRLQKDADEIAAIRRAVAINDRGLAAARRAIRHGATEIDVFAAVYGEILRDFGAPYTLIGDFVSGPRTERVGGPATARELQSGDLFIIDIFPILDWYKGDITRTFVVGEPTSRQRDVHRVLEEALAVGAAAIRPGLRACDLDAVVREAVSRAGFGENFPHHSGHAIGLGHPESPYIIPADASELRPNMVITLEPGIYLPGEGGMRLEQNFLITESGAEGLSQFPLELIVCE